MHQENVKIPMGEWAKTRLKALGKNDVIRFNSQVGSGFGKNIANWIGREMAYPTNVLHLATETGNKNHSATFPRALPDWFIKLFTKEGDWILDPFAGSGTTCEVAHHLGRNSVGIDIQMDYIKLAEEKLKEAEMFLLEEKGKYGRSNKRRHNKIH
jgi:DNA modification methylase